MRIQGPTNPRESYFLQKRDMSFIQKHDDQAWLKWGGSLLQFTDMSGSRGGPTYREFS